MTPEEVDDATFETWLATFKAREDIIGRIETLETP